MTDPAAPGEPLYVVRLDADARRVVVGPRDELGATRVPLAQVNWLGDAPFDEAPDGGWELEVKIRSTRPPRAARVSPLGDGRAEAILASAEEGVAPGQACVFYAPDGDRVLGGGWITR